MAPFLVAMWSCATETAVGARLLLARVKTLHARVPMLGLIMITLLPATGGRGRPFLLQPTQRVTVLMAELSTKTCLLGLLAL